MNLCCSLSGWLLLSVASAVSSRADILIVPGPAMVQVRSGAWDPTRLTVRQGLRPTAESATWAPPGPAGDVAYGPRHRGEWRARLVLRGLRPQQTYSFGLTADAASGGPALPASENVAGGRLRRYDFLPFTTDETGAYRADVAVALVPGLYRVTLDVLDRQSLVPVLVQPDVAFRVE